MIARVAYFEGMTEDQQRAARDNVNRRFMAAITSQPGLTALFHLEQSNGDRVSISIWESRQAMEQGGARANATPLLPGQRAEDIPSAGRVEICQVRDYFVAPEASRTLIDIQG